MFDELLMKLYKEYFSKVFSNDVDFMLVKDGVLVNSKKIEHNHLQIVVLKCILLTINDYRNIHKHFIKLDEDLINKLEQLIKDGLDGIIYKEENINKFIKEYDVNIEDIKYNILKMLKESSK